MNEYRWEDVSVGLCHSFTTVFTNEMTLEYSRISGDTNPLHIDSEYAKHAGFAGPVLFGLMTSSLYSRLVGVYLPGKYGLLHGIDIDFNAPCYAGETLHCEGEVVFVNEAYRRIELKASIRNEQQKRISKALIRVGFHD